MKKYKKSISVQARTSAFQQALLSWYAQHGRDLPWRRTRDPYAVVVSEMMLQQTQVSRVLEKHAEWMQAFPRLEDLARAPVKQVLRHWQGLGYNRRALYLQRLAQTVMQDHGGVFPRSKQELLKLPGVGPHTAGALMSFSFGSAKAIYDINAKRVVGRVLLGYKKLKTTSPEALDKLIDASIPDKKSIYAFNQALMDEGALICVAKRPRCKICPLKKVCLSCPDIQTAPATDLRFTSVAKETQFFGQPQRIWRGKILRYLHTVDPRGATWQELGQAIQTDFSAARQAWLKGVVAKLEQEGFVRQKIRRVFLP